MPGDLSREDSQQQPTKERFQPRNVSPDQPLDLCGSRAMKVESDDRTDPLELATRSCARGLDKVKTAILRVSGNVEETCQKFIKNNLTPETENLQTLTKSDEFSTADKESGDGKIGKTCETTIEPHGHVCTASLDKGNETNENDTTFECDVCSKVFATKPTLSRHLKRHSRTDALECGVCNLKCNTNKTLQSHFESSHKENSNLERTSLETENVYESPTRLSNHVNKTHDTGTGSEPSTDDNKAETKDPPVRPEIVNAPAYDVEELIERVFKIEHVACGVCKREFKDRLALANHLDGRGGCEPKRRKRSRDASLCSYCGKVFGGASNLTQHIRGAHLRVKGHKCDRCDKSFGSSTALRNHFEAAHDESKFECPLCGALLCSSNGLGSHLRMHRNKDKPPTVRCPVCPKVFRHKKNVDRHMRTHTGETPFGCSHCPRRFTLEWNLIQHERLHTGEKRYVCDKCGKAFTHNVSRKNHMKYHKDDL